MFHFDILSLVAAIPGLLMALVIHEYAHALIADKMGDIMQELGTKMQVFAITHLPQIAAKGKDHYFVYKEDTDERTVTRIRKMNKEERVKEIARMLSGASLTSASIANAKELLKSKI